MNSKIRIILQCLPHEKVFPIPRDIVKKDPSFFMNFEIPLSNRGCDEKAQKDGIKLLVGNCRKKKLLVGN
jgi:hypothetical protein